jgi:ABC-type branched-subunit amino acid transport system ATPase component
MLDEVFAGLEPEERASLLVLLFKLRRHLKNA